MWEKIIKMKSLDPNITNYFSKKTIKLTFQQWKYKGIACVEIGGNVPFADLLSNFEDPDNLLRLLKQKSSKFNFDFKYLGEDDYGEEWYQAILINDKGEECECEDLLESLPDMLVAVELVDIKEE